MNYCNCPNCRTENCPNAESYATKAEHENDVFVMKDIIRLRRVEAELRAEISHQIKLRAVEHDEFRSDHKGEDCSQVIEGLESRLSAQREEIEKLRAALEELYQSVLQHHNDGYWPSASLHILPKASAALTKPQPPQT